MNAQLMQPQFFIPHPDPILRTRPTLSRGFWPRVREWSRSCGAAALQPTLSCNMGINQDAKTHANSRRNGTIEKVR